MDKEYIIIVDNDRLLEQQDFLSMEEIMVKTTATATVFTKAYKNGLSMADIARPSIGYRRALELVRSKRAVQITDQIGPGKLTIIHAKKFT